MSEKKTVKCEVFVYKNFNCLIVENTERLAVHINEYLVSHGLQLRARVFYSSVISESCRGSIDGTEVRPFALEDSRDFNVFRKAVEAIDGVISVEQGLPIDPFTIELKLNSEVGS